ncbi:MFS transporter [Spongiactinospora sp. TRM90649]|uniref:MFS transporter n=1 Tax=Spongiactinospora sp. TRM90649 TaxID=3031114 RepID=UPI0023F6FEF1|nr:MFS transporter [Spongiactinospora sp. TRM90649]MDF5752059.1 MFS transporter [Spongiactinospora sp. TRM90649]
MTSVERAGAARLSHGAAFWLVGAMLVLMLYSASAPSPLYGVYQRQWGFSDSTLTVVFGIYALTVLIGLLGFGSLSDALGRRRVLLGSLAVMIASMVIFILAQGVPALLAARAVQGLAVGLATGAMGAALLELAPSGAPGRGTLVNATGPTLGLALGGLGAGLLVQYAPAPTVMTYAIMLAGFLVLFAGVLLMPETAPGAGGPVRIRPHRVRVPRSAHRSFAVLSLGLIAIWAVGGFYLSLGPSLVRDLLDTDDRLIGGLVIAILAGVAAAGQMVAHNWPARRPLVLGLVLLLAGLGAILLTLAVVWPPIFFVGTAVLGLGWGLAFLGVFRSMAALAEPAHRGELLAAVYVVAYLAMSVPAISAGLVTDRLGLHQATTIFILAVAVVCLAALAGSLWPTSRRTPGGEHGA